jgi:hypothetical protein
MSNILKFFFFPLSKASFLNNYILLDENCQKMLGGPEPGHEELRHRGAGGLGAAPPGEQRRHPAQGGGHNSRTQAQVVAGGARGRRLPGRVLHEKKN